MDDAAGAGAAAGEPEAGDRYDFVAGLPQDVPTAKVVQLAKAKGIEGVTSSYVSKLRYNLRHRDAQRRDAPKKQPKKRGRPAKGASKAARQWTGTAFEFVKRLPADLSDDDAYEAAQRAGVIISMGSLKTYRSTLRNGRTTSYVPAAERRERRARAATGSRGRSSGRSAPAEPGNGEGHGHGHAQRSRAQVIAEFRRAALALDDFELARDILAELANFRAAKMFEIARSLKGR